MTVVSFKPTLHKHVESWTSQERFIIPVYLNPMPTVQTVLQQLGQAEHQAGGSPHRRRRHIHNR